MDEPGQAAGREVSLRDPAERSRLGAQRQAELLGAPAPEPRTLFESSWRDYVFSEVWTRPGLDLRSRYLIAISCAVCQGGRPDVLDGYIRGALKRGELTLAEMREAVLQLAVYGGWSRGAAFDTAVTRVVRELGLGEAEYPPIRKDAWDPEQRIAEGSACFTTVMCFPAPKPMSPYIGAGIIDFVFGEMWLRPGLDQRSRRWITLVGVADSARTTPIRTHVYAAMASGNATAQEMQEFVLQYAVDGSWPKASYLQGVVFEMAERVRKGLPYE